VDTRSKIVNEGQLPRPITLVTGYFEVLRVEHLRALEKVRCGNPHLPLVLLVLQREGELVSQHARARVVAALRVVDYVLIADHEDPDAILVRLQPAAVFRLEAADLHSSRVLIEHAQRQQKL
jgi:bifunctional ADP-heptose synthase (sugar kinase/adenylyltransferase)